MTNKVGEADSRPLIAIHILGERFPAMLVELSAIEATVQLLRQQSAKPGLFVALSIADLPSFAGDITKIEDDLVTVKFRPALHPSVIETIRTTSG